ncbi:MAG TPA: hypothetical protein VF116_03215 [Ktedonobacterales bacterium]
MSCTSRIRGIGPSSTFDVMPAPVAFSLHAARRAARRNIRRDGAAYVVAYGRLYHRTGARFFFLGARDLPFEDRRDAWAARLVGTVVVMAPDGEVITTYRNCRAPRRIARKMKYRLFDEPFRRDVLCDDARVGLDAIA